MSQQIVHNTGVNYTLYYNALNYFKTIMSNHPSIAAVTQGDITKIDVNQFPAYPLGNILITESNFGSNITNYTIQLTVADKIKNKNNESGDRTNAQTVPFYGVDDVVDIHANTLGILNDLTSYTQRGVAGFEINGDINCTSFSDQFNNGLAGWVATFELTTHNDKNRCLFFLINPSGSGYIIENCVTEEKYKAVIQQEVELGQVFSTKTFPVWTPSLQNYTGLRCFTVGDTFEGEDDFDFVNLQVLPLPLSDYGTCENCELWINPKVWSTTPETWDLAPVNAFREWQYE
jgi:hypothetical protein